MVLHQGTAFMAMQKYEKKVDRLLCDRFPGGQAKIEKL
jgi:hypothetical protein